MPNRRSVRFPVLRPVLMTGAAMLAFAVSPAFAQSQDRFVPPMGDWSLPPSGQQAPTPTPAPAPAPADQAEPTTAQPPVVVPTITPTPTPAQPRVSQPQTTTPAPAPGPTPTPQPTAPASTSVSEADAPADTTTQPLPEISAPAPQPLPDATTAPDVADQPSGGIPRWLIALAAIGLAGGAGWFLFRRRRDPDAVDQDGAPEILDSSVEPAPPAMPVPRAPRMPAGPVPVRRVAAEVANPNIRRAVPGMPAPAPAAPPTPAPQPTASAPDLPEGLITTRIPPVGRASPPPPPPAPRPTAAPVVPLPTPSPRPRANGGGLGFILNAQRITVSMTQLMLEFELIAENHTDVAVTSLDVATAMLTAHAGQDDQIARFFEERPPSPSTALEVGPHTARGLNGKLSMPLGQVNPVETGGRSYCVPIMMIDARYTWADGREERKSVAFVMGKGAQDANKLGPIFLDRGPGVTREVGARLHMPLRKAS